MTKDRDKPGPIDSRFIPLYDDPWVRRNTKQTEQGPLLPKRGRSYKRKRPLSPKQKEYLKELGIPIE